MAGAQRSNLCVLLLQLMDGPVITTMEKPHVTPGIPVFKPHLHRWAQS